MSARTAAEPLSAEEAVHKAAAILRKRGGYGWADALAILEATPATGTEGLDEAVEAYIAWQYRMRGARRFTLTDLRAVLGTTR